MYRRRLPVYNRRQRSSAALINIILIGVIVGLGFLLLNGWRLPTPPAEVVPVATVSPTAARAATTPTVAPTGEPQARLFIPTAGVTAQVVDTYLDDQSWDVSQLGNNAGHLQGTGWFGAPGNIALAGHVELADGSPGIFATIDRLAQGDPIVLTLGVLEQRYAVTEIKKVAPDDMRPLYPTTNDQITLITCNSYDFLQNDYEQRVVVIAERIS